MQKKSNLVSGYVFAAVLGAIGVLNISFLNSNP